MSGSDGLSAATKRHVNHAHCGTRRRAVIASLALLIACETQDKLPTAPSDLTTGIVVYQHADYLGASAHITQDVTHLKDYKGPCLRTESDGNGVSSTIELWDDCISSVRVASGWQALLYRDEDFDGDLLRASQDLPNLTLARATATKAGSTIA